MFIRLLIGINKNTKFFEKNVCILKIMKNLPSTYKEYFVGVDLCGEHELTFDEFVNYKYMINDYKSCGYKVTVHLYETKVNHLKLNIIN